MGLSARYVTESRYVKRSGQMAIENFGLSSAKLVAENIDIQNKVKEALEKGVKISACRACSEQLEVKDILEKMNIEVIYWGEPLTKLLKDKETLITI